MAQRASRQNKDRRGKNPAPQQVTYAALSQQPLHILVFLAPLIVLYELGSAFYLTFPAGADQTESVVETIRAYHLIEGLYQTLGIGAIYLPGALVITVLIIWHLLRRDRWRIEFPVLGGMLAESLAWTLPLLVLVHLIGQTLAAAAPTADLALRTWQGRATMAIGAGLYEELLFRMVAIAMLHLIAVDLIGLKNRTGAIVAVILAAIAFTFYHDLASAGINPVSLAIFYFLAGIYFGAIYLMRGLGIVVAVHAIYDLIVLLLQQAP